MRIVIVGAGLVGTQLAQHLIQENHEVSILEASEERVRHLSNRLDCLVIHDGGNNLRALEEAGIATADVLVCVTNSDEVNMIICGVAECKYPDLIKIARVRNDDYIRINYNSKNHKHPALNLPAERIMGIDHFVNPDIEAANAALHAIEHGALGDVLEFTGTDYELFSIKIALGSVLDGLALKDYRSVVKEMSLVTLLERNGVSILPGGSVVLAAGDSVHILAKESDHARIFQAVGSTGEKLRKIGIVGGSHIGQMIAEGLLQETGSKINNPLQEIAHRTKSFVSFIKGVIRKSNRSVTIIENDYNICKELSSRFPGALVLNEDISDENFISEERINDLDLIVAATGNQELNIITSLYLKTRGVKRAIAFVQNDGYAAIARKLGVDVVIPIKSVIVDTILSHLSGRLVRAIHRIGDGTIGIFEIEISAESVLVHKPITEFHLASGGLLMLANRGGVSFIPKGDYIFNTGDHIVLIAKNGGEKEIEKYFNISL
ncbi:Trk system potassium transport protein TrkA [Spirochaetia bacterium]|nr:Trk system potassium transport protein TrkA [Spirochaetia bacterium]